MGSFINPYGGGVAEYDGKWQPHWGVDIRDYIGTDEIGFLLSDTGIFTAKIYGSTSGAYTAKIYGKNGLISETDISTTIVGVDYVFDPSSLSNPFEDPYDYNGYNTYILVLSNKIINITRIDVFNSATNIGCCWLESSNSSILIFNSGQSGGSLFTEKIKGKSLGNNSFIYLPSLKLAELTTGSNGTTLFYEDTALEEVIGIENCVSTTFLNMFFGCRNLKEVYMDSFSNNSITTMNGCFKNCYSYNKPIGITSTSLINFGGNTDMRSLPFLSIDAPLTLFVISNAYNLKSLALSNTNFKSLVTTTNAIDIKNAYSMTATELTAFLTGLEDLTGYTAQNILKTRVTNWNAEHTAAANDKNWNVV